MKPHESVMQVGCHGHPVAVDADHSVGLARLALLISAISKHRKDSGCILFRPRMRSIEISVLKLEVHSRCGRSPDIGPEVESNVARRILP